MSHRRLLPASDPLDRGQLTARLNVTDRLDDPIRQVVKFNDMTMRGRNPCWDDDCTIGHARHAAECAPGLRQIRAARDMRRRRRAQPAAPRVTVQYVDRYCLDGVLSGDHIPIPRAFSDFCRGCEQRNFEAREGP